MVRNKDLEVIVGLFMLAGIIGLMLLAIKVSGLHLHTATQTYTVSATFDNIGSLKVRAPVTLAGVRIGQVSAINLNPETLQAKVTMAIDDNYRQIPDSSQASILTQGVLGANYVGLSSGYFEEGEEEGFLKQGSVISQTHSALILEDLIGKFLYNMNNKGA